MESSEPSQSDPSGEQQQAEEVFQIIDETGEGFGFDITPEALAKPLAVGAVSLFSIGMLAGVPFGLAFGHGQEDSKRAKVTPSLAGVRFAASTFGLGTLLCAAMGATAVYGVRTYYQVETFEEFGNIMRRDVPQTREKMENGLAPLLQSVRKNARDSLPEPMKRWRARFLESGVGKWIKSQVDVSVVVDETSDSCENPSAGPPA